MTGSRTHAGGGAGEAIRKGAGLVHGTGEALRGNFNAAVDGIAGDRAGVQKNEAIAARGTDEMDHGYHHDRGTGAGVTPVDTTAERHHRNAQGEFTHGTGSANYGPHATNIGNKVDPRVDSDLDGRGANPPYGTNTYVHPDNLDMYDKPPNYVPHHSNISNKFDPRYDSQLDYSSRRTHDEDLRTSSFEQASRDLMQRTAREHTHGAAQDVYNVQHYESCGPHSIPISNGYHSNYVPNVLDPRIDSRTDPFIDFSEVSQREPIDPKSSRPAPLLQRRKSEPLQYYITGWDTAQNPAAARQAQWKPLPLLPPYPYTSYPSPYSHSGYEHLYGYPYLYNDADIYDYTSQRADAPKVTGKAESREQPQTHGESQHPPHSNRVMNIIDPRTPMFAPKGNPHSTQYPHKSGWLNLLDPRVDRKASRKGGRWSGEAP